LMASAEDPGATARAFEERRRRRASTWMWIDKWTSAGGGEQDHEDLRWCILSLEAGVARHKVCAPLASSVRALGGAQSGAARSSCQVAAGPPRPCSGSRGRAGCPAPGRTHASLSAGRSRPRRGHDLDGHPVGATVQPDRRRVANQHAATTRPPPGSYHNQPHAPCPHGCRHGQTKEAVEVRLAGTTS
jgi:hypothetical protein